MENKTIEINANILTPENETIDSDKDYLVTIHNMTNKVTIEIETVKKGAIYINNVVVK
ncbi:MAG: hypothetical protein IIZ94_11980 [Prevotella sp.]|nr:hypothetical protein [Prevotella sp.]